MAANTNSSENSGEKNIKFPERVISIISGTLLLCGFFRKKRPLLRSLTAGYLIYRGASGRCPAKEGVIDILNLRGQNIDIKTSITVNKPREEVYNFWRKLDNLPLFMKHLKTVKSMNKSTSEWEAYVPGGMGTVSWKSKITEDVPNERIVWSSVPDSQIENEGNVSFRDAGKFGTEIHAFISYRPPAGKAGEGLGRLLNPAFREVVKEDIRNFRRYMETGEVPVSNNITDENE